MRNELIAIDKTNPWKKVRESGSGYRRERGVGGTCDGGQTQTGRSSSSPIHDHLDQFCKRWETKVVSFTVDLSIRDPLQLQREVLRPVPHIQGWRRCIWKQIPNILLSPKRKKETLRRGTERKRWGNHLYLLPSQSIWPRLQPRKSWLEKPSSRFCVPLVEKQRKVGVGGGGMKGATVWSKSSWPKSLKASSTVSVQRREQSAQEQLIAVIWLVEKRGTGPFSQCWRPIWCIKK